MQRKLSTIASLYFFKYKSISHQSNKAVSKNILSSSKIKCSNVCFVVSLLGICVCIVCTLSEYYISAPPRGAPGSSACARILVTLSQLTTANSGCVRVLCMSPDVDEWKCIKYRIQKNWEMTNNIISNMWARSAGRRASPGSIVL